MLFIRGTGPIGYPGGAEVVNMQPPAYLLRKGVHALPCIGDGRQAGTSGSPSILNASPEAAAGGRRAPAANVGNLANNARRTPPPGRSWCRIRPRHAAAVLGFRWQNGPRRGK